MNSLDRQKDDVLKTSSSSMMFLCHDDYVQYPWGVSFSMDPSDPDLRFPNPGFEIRIQGLRFSNLLGNVYVDQNQKISIESFQIFTM